MKRAIEAVEAEPRLNFWRLISGNQMDIAVIEWCKVFGSDAEATHWKKVVPRSEHDAFRTRMLSSMGLSAAEWGAYWKEMKQYRDNLAAHHNESVKVPRFPFLELALKSSCFYDQYIVRELESVGVIQCPSDLAECSMRFEAQARELASHAMHATDQIDEKVG